MRYERLHWLGVKDKDKGKGIAKALVSYICEQCKGTMYLSTQSWSYPAIHIYEQFGFVPWNPYGDVEFDDAWRLIHSILQKNN